MDSKVQPGVTRKALNHYMRDNRHECFDRSGADARRRHTRTPCVGTNRRGVTARWGENVLALTVVLPTGRSSRGGAPERLAGDMTDAGSSGRKARSASSRDHGSASRHWRRPHRLCN